ncbi:MAG: hypothetical protein U5K84_12130 [Alkalibacterium sp.]|nr:hypothetical protein [Alkalibacterium sp.]
MPSVPRHYGSGLVCRIASLIAKDKYTDAEIRMAAASILQGWLASAEATLPYAFRDPIRVIGSNVFGAAIGGALMMGFGISTSGVSGVFGLPMASNILLFILAILVGTVISVALQDPLWKEPVGYACLLPKKTILNLISLFRNTKRSCSAFRRCSSFLLFLTDQYNPDVRMFPACRSPR